MIVGVPKEIKEGEFRVSLLPGGVQRLTTEGHGVRIETGAGRVAGFDDTDYSAAGADILPDMASVYEQAEMVLKVKEILPPEYDLLREDLIVFTYLHSAARPEETQVLLDKKVIGIAYEDVKTDDGQFPLLVPMSEIAGEVGMMLGAVLLFATHGGAGVLMGGAPGVEPAKVAVLGAGHAGVGAARYAVAMGADVTMLDVDPNRLRQVRQAILPNVKTLYCDRSGVERILPEVDMLVNAVKWSPGLTLVSRDMLKLMKRGALIVDIDCQLGGAIETCRYTTHDNPVYEIDGVRHCCVANLPSAAARTASCALCNATLPHVLAIANLGWLQAVKADSALRHGLGFARGYLTFKPTAEAQNRVYTSPEKVLDMFDS